MNLKETGGKIITRCIQPISSVLKREQFAKICHVCIQPLHGEYMANVNLLFGERYIGCIYIVTDPRWQFRNIFFEFMRSKT